MALIVEDGTGVVGAESYADVAFIDAFWAKRTHDPLAATWAELSTAQKEGCAVESTAHLEAVAGPYYRGTRAGTVQGLLFPRTGAVDDAGFDLPDLPTALPHAVALLSPHAASSRLSVVSSAAGDVKSETKKVGSLSKSVEYTATVDGEKRFGTVFKSLHEVLTDGNPWAVHSGWSFC